MKKFSIISIAIIILLAGCTPGPANGTKTNAAGQVYSFEDPDIIAYVDGEPVSRASMNNYIVMKKAYTKAYAEFIEGYSFNGGLEDLYIRWYEELIKDTLPYSEDDWVKDYYRSVFLSKKFHETVKNPDEELKDIADWEVQGVFKKAEGKDIYIIEVDEYPDTVDEYPDTGSVSIEVDNNSLNVVPVIQAIADELGISFEECVNSVYRPFYITKYIYDHFLNSFIGSLDYGERVEYNGDNGPEYEAYVLKVMRINKDYLDSLFEQAEIVERP